MHRNWTFWSFMSVYERTYALNTLASQSCVAVFLRISELCQLTLICRFTEPWIVVVVMSQWMVGEDIWQVVKDRIHYPCLSFMFLLQRNQAMFSAELFLCIFFTSHALSGTVNTQMVDCELVAGVPRKALLDGVLLRLLRICVVCARFCELVNTTCREVLYCWLSMRIHWSNLWRGIAQLSVPSSRCRCWRCPTPRNLFTLWHVCYGTEK